MARAKGVGSPVQRQPGRTPRAAKASLRLPLLATIVFATSVAVYANTLSHAFVYDDVNLLVRNPWIRDVAHLPTIFSSPAWGFRGFETFYRPLINLLFLLQYHLFGMRPWGFHLTNVLLHAGCSVLVLFVARDLLRAKPSPEQDPEGASRLADGACLAAALVFATHPVHTESVAWISGVQDVAAVFLGLLAVHLHLRSRRPIPILPAVCYFLATLCKENAVLLPLLLVAGDHALRRDTSPRELSRRYAAHAAAIAVYLALRLHALGGLAPAGAREPIEFASGVASSAYLFAWYLGKLVFPFGLNAAYVFRPLPGLLDARSIAGLAVAGAFAAALVVAARRRSLLFPSMAWFALPLLPALYLPALGNHPFADRHLYWPSVGLSLAVAVGARRFVRPARFLQPATAATLALIVLGGFSIATIARNRIWRDGITLWSDTVRSSPEAVVPRNNLGQAYADEGRTGDAIREFQAALRLDSSYNLARTNLGNALIRAGRHAEGARELEIAVRQNPSDGDALSDLGLAYASLGRIEEAVNTLRSATRLQPDHAEAHNNLGNLLLGLGRLDEGISELRTSLSLGADQAATRFNLAVAYAEKGMRADALHELREVLRLRPADAEARSLLEELSR